MKKLIALLVLLCGFMPLLWAADGCEQHLSREEFRTKQKAYIIEQAKLTKEEAAKFFPIYFELQDKKKKLNDESWNLMRKGKDDKSHSPLLFKFPHESDLVGVDVLQRKGTDRTFLCIEADRNALYHPDIVDGGILLEISKLDLPAFRINLDRRDRRWNLLHER